MRGRPIGSEVRLHALGVTTRRSRWGRRAQLLLPPVLALVLTTCEPFTQPTTTTDVALSFRGDSILVVGDTVAPSVDVTADGTPLEQPRLRFLSSDGSVIAVTANGTHLAAVTRGVATITVELVGSTTAEPPSKERVFVVHAGGVRMSRSAVTLQSLHDTVTVGAAVLTRQGDSIPAARPDRWTTTDPAVATVNATTGLITAVANGTARIGAVADDDSNAVTVTVQQRLARHTFTPATLLLQSLGDTAKLTVTPLDSGG